MPNNSPRPFTQAPADIREWHRWFQTAFRHNYTVETVPDASVSEGDVIYVSNESGGAVLAFSDGNQWLRVNDRVPIS